MNAVAFDEEKGDKFDGNFISVFSKERDDYEYFVQRLVGQEIDSENEPKNGKVWVPYINERREDWSFICENNRIITKEDEVLWRFEKYLSKDHFNTNGLTAIPDGGELGSGNNPSTKAASRAGELR